MNLLNINFYEFIEHLFIEVLLYNKCVSIRYMTVLLGNQSLKTLSSVDLGMIFTKKHKHMYSHGDKTRRDMRTRKIPKN